MKTHTLLGSIILVGGLLSCQGKPQLEWVASTETACWQTEEPLPKNTILNNNKLS